MGQIVLAVDLGGTNLRIAAVESRGRIIHRGRCSTPRESDPDQIVDAIDRLADECRQAVRSEALICSIGVAVPATMDVSKGLIHYAPNLPMLNGLLLSSKLEERLGLQVTLENDATSAAIGEHWLGASRECASSICITLGTGVGGGIILDNKPLRGPDGTAGEIGHICVEPNGHPCGCGSWGCLEQYSSATAVVRMANELIVSNADSVLSDKKDLTAEDVYIAAGKGDPVAIEAFRRMGFYLGIVIAGLANGLNPEAVVLAGGMSAAWDVFIEYTREQLMKRAFHEPASRVKLVRAELGDDAGILGVASLAFQASGQGLLEA